MAKKPVGITSKPPATLPNGMSRNSKAGIEYRRQQAAIRKSMPKDKYNGLNNTENRLINQTGGQDIYLGDAATNMLPGAVQGLQTPVDWNGLPSAPVTGDFNAWRQQQIDNGAEDFNNRFADQFKQDNQDFETMAYQRGWSPGSDLYNRMHAAHVREQNDAKTANLRQAYDSAGQNASALFSVGTQARNNALGEQQQRRYQGLTDYQAIQAARSPMGQQAYGNQANYTGMDKQAEAGMALQQANAAAAAGLAAQNNAAAMARTQAENEAAMRLQEQQNAWANANKPKTPNPWAQAGGQLGGGLISGIVGGLFK